jgi:hypothetical protein
MIQANAWLGGSFKKIIIFHKSPFYSVKFVYIFIKYHWLNGLFDHVTKVIKSILIGTQVDILNTCTTKKIIWELIKYNNGIDLWKYGPILVIHKSLARNWLWFLREELHIKVYYFMPYHILRHYK